MGYMHARFFSAHLGRFHSVDAVGGLSGLPQSWNRYSYVIGNPLKYTDPRGQYLFPFFLPLGDIPIAIFEDTTMVIESFLQLRAHDPLTGVSGHGYLLAGSAMMLRLSAALGGGQGKFALNTGGPNEFQLNLYERGVSRLDIDGVEYGRCVRGNRLDYWEVIAGSAVPKRVVPPFRVPNPSQPLTTPASVAAHGVNRAFPQSAAARNLARGLRGGGRVVSRVATPLTIAEGLYDIGVLGYCGFAD